MARDIGAELIHMDMVQVHPTGLVDPRDPDAKWKVNCYYNIYIYIYIFIYIYIY